MNPAHKFYTRHTCLIHFALWALLPIVSASKLCTTIFKNPAPLYERFNNVHRGFMRALEIRISLSRVVEKYAQRFMKVIKHASPLYERFNNVHHGFVKALKMSIAFVMTLSKKMQHSL